MKRRVVVAIGLAMLVCGGLRVMGDTLSREYFAVMGGRDIPETEPAFTTYSKGANKAYNTSSPLVTFHGVEPREVPGCVCCVSSPGELTGFPPGVIVSWWTSDGRHMGTRAGVNPSDDQIHDILIQQTGSSPAALRAVVKQPIQYQGIPVYQSDCPNGQCPTTTRWRR